MVVEVSWNRKGDVVTCKGGGVRFSAFAVQQLYVDVAFGVVAAVAQGTFHSRHQLATEVLRLQSLGGSEMLRSRNPCPFLHMTLVSSGY